jgi:hypothetical protein
MRARHTIGELQRATEGKMKRALIVTAMTVLVLSGGPSTAGAVAYTFSGANGLAGSFTLDGNTPFATTVDMFGTSGVLMSPLNHISGVFGAFTFQGTPSLFVSDLFTECCGGAQDSWIVRSNITGPTVNGLTPALLNLFIFRGADAVTQISLIPPAPGGSPFDFQYTFGFTDGSFSSGPLTTLTLVPEPSSVSSVVLGLIAIVAVHRRQTYRHSRRADAH